jgi:excisionase family DNA binding protein
MTDPAPRYLSVPEAADYAGYCTRTIRNRIKAGDLPARKPRGSRLWRIKIADLDVMLAGREPLGAEPGAAP